MPPDSIAQRRLSMPSFRHEYRQDQSSPTWHIFEGQAGLDEMGYYPMRPLCGARTPGDANSIVAESRPAESETICEQCSTALSARST
jgi:hypothetical protein